MLDAICGFTAVDRRDPARRPAHRNPAAASARPNSVWAAHSRVSTCTRTSPSRRTSLSARPTTGSRARGRRRRTRASSADVARGTAGRRAVPGPASARLDRAGARRAAGRAVARRARGRARHDRERMAGDTTADDPRHRMTILMIDHDMGLVLGLCDHIHVLDFGAVIASGTAAEIRTEPPRRRGLPRHIAHARR